MPLWYWRWHQDCLHGWPTWMMVVKPHYSHSQKTSLSWKEEEREWNWWVLSWVVGGLEGSSSSHCHCQANSWFYQSCYRRDLYNLQFFSVTFIHFTIDQHVQSGLWALVIVVLIPPLTVLAFPIRWNSPSLLFLLLKMKEFLWFPSRTEKFKWSPQNFLHSSF